MASKTIQITIEGNNISAIKSIDGVETKLKTMQTTGSSAFSKLDSTLGTFGLSLNKLAIGGLIGGFTALVKSSIDLGDELNDMSKKTGVSVEQLSTLKYAAEQSGTSLEGMNTSLKFLNKNIYDAANGGKETGAAFQKLGVQVRDAAGNLLSADQAMYKIADEFKNMTDGAEKTALALKVFGKSGSDMIPILNEGSASIIKMQEEAKKLGLQMGTKTAREMDEIKDTMTKLEGSVKGLSISFISNLGGPVSSVLTNLAEGLDVVFGRTELINGVQFRTPVMSLEMMNELTKLLQGTTKEYREELIKNIQTQIAINMGNMLEAEYKLQIFNTQWGILTLLTDEDDIQEQKVRTAKAQIAALTQQLDLIKKINDEPTNVGFDIDEEKEKAKELKKAWDGVAAGLRRENMIAGLDPQSKKLAELIHKANQLKEKYQLIPGAIEQINYNLQTSIAGQFKLTDSLKPFYETKLEKPPTVIPRIDDSAAIESYDRIKNKSLEVSLADRLNFEIMQGYGAQAFGAMGNAASAFYELSGNKSKEMFALSKAFSIGQAIMNTYTGATKALEQGGIFGPVMAAGVIAFGIAQVAKIASQQPTTSAGGSMSAGSIPRSSIPDSGARAYTNQTTNNNAKQVNVTVNVNSQVLTGDSLAKWVRDKLSVDINKAINDGIIKFGTA